MDIRLFSTFLRVAELQNFTKAAEQLGYSQATVTVQIHQLEQALGIQLFERIGKRVRMTEHGEQFIPYAIEILKAEQNAKDFLREPENPSGRLRIGTAESLLLSVLTPILMEYHHRYPDVMVSIHTGLIHELFDMVRQNDVDLLFFLDKKTDFADWVKLLEQQEPILFVASHNHMICRKKKVSLAEVVREPFVLTEKSVSYRYDLEQLLAEKKLEIHPFLETGNTDILVRILLHGNCLSFLPQYVVRPYLLSGKMQTVDVEDCRIQMWSQLVYHKNKWVTPQMNCFITLMKEKMGKVI